MSKQDGVLEPPEKKLKTDGQTVVLPAQGEVPDVTKTFEEKEKGDVVVCVEDNVDTLLPWFDHYEICALKAECETVLMTLPVTVARLVEAHQMRLDKQYQRCLVELPPEEFKGSFQKLANEPDILRDLVCKNKEPGLSASLEGPEFSGPFNAELQGFAVFLEQFTSNDKDIKAASPILSVCLRNCDLLDNDICSKIGQMPWTAPEAIQVGVDLLTVFLDKKRSEKQEMKYKMRFQIMHLANTVYDSLPRTKGVDSDAKNLILRFTANW